MFQKTCRSAVAFLLLTSGVVAQPAEIDTPKREAVSADPFLAFQPYSAISRYELDHAPWSAFLLRGVYFTGTSNRVAAGRDDNTRISGTKLTTGSKSRYRYEGNRVLFHAFDEKVETYISTYRDALQDTIRRVDYAALSRDEQLAFWLNLYNAVVVDEITRVYPISRPHKLRAGPRKEPLFEAKLVTVNGIDLSLNDIRFNIVYRYWRDPDVIYGFWNGSIGSPNLQKIAYSGSSVPAQLDANAREFVNSLRGVDRIRGELRVSQTYFDARQFFPDWPKDLYTHLYGHASADVANILDFPPKILRAAKFDSHTADVTSGETIRYTGNDNAAIVAAGASLGGIWSKLSDPASRGGLPGEAVTLQRKSEERLKERPRSRVIIVDIEAGEPLEGDGKLPVEGDDAQNGTGE